MNLINLEELLGLANPTAGPKSSLDDRALADLRRILSTDPGTLTPTVLPLGRRSRDARRRVALRAGLVAAVTALLVIGSSAVAGKGWLPQVTRGSAAHAATPPLLQVRKSDLTEFGLAPPVGGHHANAVLTQLADRVANLSDGVGHGGYARVSTESWALWTTVDGDQVTSQVVPSTTTAWVAADGSGRVVKTVGENGEHFDARFGPGGRGLMWRLGSLSADPQRLAAQLAADHPVENGAAERLVAVTDLYREQPLLPSVRAQVLRYLADTPGLELTGAVTDRAGRPGLAVHLDSNLGGLPNRRTLILDPRTGALLGEEEMLTETPGKLNVPIPSVISYTSYLLARYESTPG